MKTTINLGKELAYHTNSITNVFTTKNYTARLIKEYEAHVIAYYDDEIVNDFSQVYQFMKIVEHSEFDHKPCDNPLKDIEQIEDELLHIVSNRKAYAAVFKILMDHAKKGGAAGTMIYDLLDVLKRDSKNFKSASEKYDRYMGHIFPVVDIIRSVHAYGQVSGLIDYYNFQEGKDGQEA